MVSMLYLELTRNLTQMVLSALTSSAGYSSNQHTHSPLLYNSLSRDVVTIPFHAGVYNSCRHSFSLLFLILLVQGDKLHGRGTTDCLGHVALITELFILLAEKKPALKYSVHAVFIAR